MQSRLVRVPGHAGIRCVVVALLAISQLQLGDHRPKGTSRRHAVIPGLSKPEQLETVRLAEAYGRLPLAFEENRGQTDSDVEFLSRGAGFTLFLTPTEAVLSLQKASPRTEASRRHQAADVESSKRAVVRMKLVDSNPAPSVS